jgi:hypothetical protein
MFAITVLVAVSIAASASAFSSPTYMREPSPDGHTPCGRLPIGMVATCEKSSVRNTLTSFKPPIVT